MIAEIAHLNGHDLAEVKVRRAVVTALLGEDGVKKAIKKKQLPGTPSTLATGPDFHSELENALSLEVATELIARVAGRQLATTVGKRVPVLGGVVGLTADSYSTFKLGRYAAREFAKGGTA
jgi:hypothetical protein